MPVTKDQMRHSDARVTLGVYGHVIGNSQRDAVNKVGEIVRPRAPSRLPGLAFRHSGHWELFTSLRKDLQSTNL
jgi:hypothetical protein